MNWIRKIFTSNTCSDTYEVKVPLVKKPEADRLEDISEPVISFVKCFKENPSRFKIKRENYDLTFPEFSLTDKITKEIWKFNMYIRWYTEVCPILRYPDFLTNQEVNYIYDQLKDVIRKIQEKLNSLRATRAQRKHKAERERLTTIYGGN